MMTRTTTNKPRILYFDIETSPMLVWTHYIGHKVSINPQQIWEDKRIICIAYQWSDENKTHILKWNTKTNDDRKMLKDFNKIAKQADLLLGHNGQNFDVKEIRTAIALRGLAESWCETPCLDTLKDCRRSFRFPSNRLDAIARSLGLGHKDSMCFQDWIDVTLGDEKALKKMLKYCKKDVKLLIEVHKRLDYYVPPTMKDVGLRRLKDREGFPKSCLECEGTEFIKYGRYKYLGQEYQKYLCKSCYKVSMPAKGA